MSMNEFKEALKSEAMLQEYTAFIEEKKPETPDALAEATVAFAEEKGYSISQEDVMNILPDELKSGKTELNDDMLDAVVGGSLWTKIKSTARKIANAAKRLFGDNDNVTPVDNTTTTMVCSSCGYTTVWAGEFSGQTFNCKACGNYTFKGK